MTTLGVHERLATALGDAGADAFAHVGVADPDLAHCLGLPADPSPPGAAVVVTPDEAACSVAAVDAKRTERRFPGRVETLDGHPSDALPDLLASVGVETGALLVPRHLPHDAAVTLERDEYRLTSTTAVADARARKDEAERDALAGAGAASVAGLVRVADLLSTATVEGGRLAVDGDPLTHERLRRDANAGVALAGAETGGTSVWAGDGRENESDEGLDPSRPVVVAVDARVEGYHGPVARTFVVDGDGGWERRAAVAAEMVHDAVRRVVEPDVPARRVVDEATAELDAYGFAPDESVAVPVARGVGRTAHEAPDFETDALRAGHVFALDPVVVDPETGRRVRIADCYVVTDDGCERLAAAPTSLSPGKY